MQQCFRDFTIFVRQHGVHEKSVCRELRKRITIFCLHDVALRSWDSFYNEKNAFAYCSANKLVSCFSPYTICKKLSLSCKAFSKSPRLASDTYIATASA